MSTEIDYGKLTKRVVFTETDHRHAQLIIRLQHDGFTQAKFFRHLISAYLAADPRIINYIDEVKEQSQTRKKKSQKLREVGQQAVIDNDLSDQQVHDLFDIIAEEHPEL